jgi:hypothetical protein
MKVPTMLRDSENDEAIRERDDGVWSQVRTPPSRLGERHDTPDDIVL